MNKFPKKSILMILILITIAGAVTISQLKDIPFQEPNPFPSQNQIIQPPAIQETNQVIIPISLNLIKDSSKAYTTKRDQENLIQLVNQANKIWAKANITFTVYEINEITPNTYEISSFLNGNTTIMSNRPEFDKGMINGYFMGSFNANGISFPPQGLFAVKDKTSVNDYRTLAHELGHLLGLKHTEDQNDLMFSGRNGEFLSEEEIEFARRNAIRVFQIN